MLFPNRSGWIEVIAGGMFSGKTDELMRRLRAEQRGPGKVIAIRPKVDTRSAPGQLESHSGAQFPCFVVDSLEEINALVRKTDATVVGFDETQFMPPGFVELCEQLANLGVQVIAAGLDLDYHGNPFEQVAALMARAEFVQKMSARCVCGNLASRSRKKRGTPERIEVGNDDMYAPCCRHCFNEQRGLAE